MPGRDQRQLARAPRPSSPQSGSPSFSAKRGCSSPGRETSQGRLEHFRQREQMQWRNFSKLQKYPQTVTWPLRRTRILVLQRGVYLDDNVSTRGPRRPTAGAVQARQQGALGHRVFCSLSPAPGARPPGQRMSRWVGKLPFWPTWHMYPLTESLQLYTSPPGPWGSWIVGLLFICKKDTLVPALDTRGELNISTPNMGPSTQQSVNTPAVTRAEARPGLEPTVSSS